MSALKGQKWSQFDAMEEKILAARAKGFQWKQIHAALRRDGFQTSYAALTTWHRRRKLDKNE